MHILVTNDEASDYLIYDENGNFWPITRQQILIIQMNHLKQIFIIFEGLIRQHINRFPTIDSYYCRKDSQWKYTEKKVQVTQKRIDCM